MKIYPRFLNCVLATVMLSIGQVSTITAQFVFEKTFGITQRNNQGFGLIQTENGNFVLCGNSDNDGMLIKTDAEGNLLWLQNFIDGGLESIRMTSDSGLILAGTNYASPYSAVYRKTDSIGTEEWNIVLNSGSFSHYGISAMELADGNFALLENDSYPFQEFLRIWKIDSTNQSVLWSTEVNKVSNCSNTSFINSPDTSLVVACGDFSNPFPHLILAKVSTDSTLTWKKDYGFPANINAGYAGNSVTSTNDSAYLAVGYKVSGSTQSFIDLLLLKADNNGDSLWTKTYTVRNSNDFPSVIQTRDGGFALIGTVQYPSSGSGFDYRILLMKTNSNGDSLWSREFTGLGLNQARQLIETNDGGFAIIGTTTDQSTNDTYFYFIKTDSTGSLITSTPGSLSNPLSIEIYPNPSGDFVNINITNTAADLSCQVELIDIFGSVLKQQDVHRQQNRISIQNFSGGIYYLRITDSRGNSVTRKLIIN
ncbi:MAG: T9SS type A sorting domain-containing protein [Bacteroidetes bacterium]|nr:T9SS type A sorting domain-containing protein [Bacteroidota bacterium]MBL0138063.1 T9SS type A sorting domain-containing protein [Bacteroidota bacterium]